MDWPRIRESLRHHARQPLVLTGVYAVLWCLLWLDARVGFMLGPPIQAIGFLTAIPVCLYWLRRWRNGPPVVYRAVLSACYCPLWQLAAHLPLLVSAYEVSALISLAGTTGAFFLGLGWAVWWIDRETKRATPPATPKRVWDPRQLVAWYFGRTSRKLRQSLFTLVTYTCLFGLVFLILTRLTGCSIYESPIGGGEEKQLRQVVRIQKVINKKYVINPYSSILFNPPPIDDVKLEVLEVTEHLYKIGQGKGEGAGFSTGTTRGKVRFIRLKYDGGDWDQDMDRGSDLNLLTEYGVRLGHPVNDRPEPMEIGRLKSFPARKSPPMVYMTGQQNIHVSDAEINILRTYLLDHHGMLFGDNGGSSGWEGQFVTMMRKVLPKVEPISVYLDHPIHRVPYVLPRLPIVAPHGRSNALGWVVDGRLVVYYHPGDIGDAWADGHSGVPHEIWESCYQLGTNVIYYAHAEYNKWLDATAK